MLATGDALRQGVKDSKVDLGGAAADLIQHTDNIYKSGSNVTINNSSAFSSKRGDVTISFAKTVSFSVGADKKTGLPGFSQIQGLSGKQGFRARHGQTLRRQARQAHDDA